jgi:hypothetical protein
MSNRIGSPEDASQFLNKPTVVSANDKAGVRNKGQTKDEGKGKGKGKFSPFDSAL